MISNLKSTLFNFQASVFCFLLFITTLTFPQTLYATQANNPVDNSLLQYTSNGHVIGFGKGAMHTASLDHALKVEFVGANDVSPSLKQNEFTAEAQSTQRKEINLCFANPGLKPESKHYSSIYLPQQIWQASKIGPLVAKSSEVLCDLCVFLSSASFVRGAVNVVEQIRLQYNVPVRIDQFGNLVLTFKTGQFKESPPVAWQEIEGERIYVDVSYSQTREKEIGFKAGRYNASLPLIIGPTLTWNTFLGGSSFDFGNTIVVDSSNNLYVVKEGLDPLAGV